MIDYQKVKRGDILRVSEPMAVPGYAQIDDLVRVVRKWPNGVKVEDKTGTVYKFLYNCGAARLEETEWKEDFPEEAVEPDSS